MGGVLPGVKPHLKVYTLPGTGGETVMQGLDSLAVRLKEYKAAGAVFAKWRSPLVIGPGQPSDLAIEANMRDLARYALICQDEGLVPIVEPDVVMKGTILKTNMVNPGLDCPTSYTVKEIAQANV